VRPPHADEILRGRARTACGRIRPVTNIDVVRSWVRVINDGLL
jgi:hypothetical protein